MSEEVRTMFGRIAEGYDRGNDAITFGLHRRWKRQLVDRLGLVSGERLLDLATGTGDIAREAARRLKGSGAVIGLDFSSEMIEVARNRADNRQPGLDFEVGDILDLRFEDGSFDVATISYGIRNVDDPIAGLTEIARVLRPGGRIGILETGRPSGLLGSLVGFFSRRIVPKIGQTVAGNRDAYEYLDRTAESFPYAENFVAMLRQAGYHGVGMEPLVGGSSYIYTAIAP